VPGRQVKTGAQIIYNYMKRLDSGFRRNDRERGFPTFYEIIKVEKGNFLYNKFKDDIIMGDNIIIIKC